jgi:DNA-binding response OmpR family regulator
LDFGTSLSDDDEKLAELLIEYLRFFEFEVFYAATPTKGFEILHSQRIDVAIFDWMLPEIEGPDLVKQVRLSQPQLPILMMSAKGGALCHRIARTAGANSYLEKPFRLSLLLEKIRQLSTKVNATLMNKTIDKKI